MLNRNLYVNALMEKFEPILSAETVCLVNLVQISAFDCYLYLLLYIKLHFIPKVYTFSRKLYIISQNLHPKWPLIQLYGKPVCLIETYTFCFQQYIFHVVQYA